MPTWTSCGAHSTTFETMRVPSSRSISAATMGNSYPGNCGWWITVKVCTVPRPEATTCPISRPRQRLHIGRGGWWSAPHPLHCWIGRTPCSTSCHHQALSWPRGARMRFGFAACAGPASAAAGRCWGTNFSTRKVSQPTSAPSWSRKVVRVSMK